MLIVLIGLFGFMLFELSFYCVGFYCLVISLSLFCYDCWFVIVSFLRLVTVFRFLVGLMLLVAAVFSYFVLLLGDLNCLLFACCVLMCWLDLLCGYFCVCIRLFLVVWL